VFGTILFFFVAPGVVVGLGPWLLSGWRMADRFPLYVVVRVVGAVLLVAAVGFLVNAFVRFVVEGLGTPAPTAPTEHLVVGGIYRYVRNPMYVAVVAAIIGQAMLLGQAVLLWYAAAIALAQAVFVRFYEEPNLRQRYGAEYDAYRQAVPAWWPRLRPWSGPPTPPLSHREPG
jgi:protein-S-isoprenylcysteine O-methyltransferase Ste14